MLCPSPERTGGVPSETTNGPPQSENSTDPDVSDASRADVEHGYRVRAPGAAVLFGDRTPDTGGYTLSVATDRATTLDATPSEAVTVTLGGQTRTFETADAQPAGDWADPVRGCYAVLADAGFEPGGFEGRVGGGLVESLTGDGLPDATVTASLELAVLALLGSAYELGLSRLEIARLARRVETEFLGRARPTAAPFAIALSKAGSVLFVDADADSYARVAVPDELQLLTVATGPDGSTAEASERRAGVRRALEELGVEAAPEVDLTMLPQLDGPGADRLGYLVRENARVSQAATALDDGDLDRFGELLDEAHHDLLENVGAGSSAVDQVVETAGEHGAYGVRAIGSEIVVAVRSDRAPALLDAVESIEADLEARAIDPADGVVVSER
ncbi:galactokinase [Halapricum desulfuricans]|uniref:Galactokinase n=1 Tax=Halapricum desulfuricans TaxID=2841257 RepID=A0A897N1T6_9EURY|nr:galactokinase [Halapricum desulfuricans]QSG05273.1 Galactokinase [Halapricum desulfuricans]